MTEVVSPRPASDPSNPDSPTDAELITLVRAGDAGAYEELFRRHRDVAIRYARRISDSERAEDLCAEAFTKIFDLLQRGKGPDVAFRAYLLTTVRTSHLNALRSLNREELVPDHEPIGRMMPVIEDSDSRFDQHAILRAFSRLPERWQAALWLTSVEGLGHDEVSEHLGIKANAVASLAFRARAGLRQAFLAEHLLETKDPECRVIVSQLPSYRRDRLSPRRRRRIEEHLDGCRSCTRAALELADVDNRLGAILAPLGLAGFATSGAAVVKIGGLALLPRVLGRLARVLGTKAGAVGLAAAATVATSVVVLHDTGGTPASVPETTASVLADAGMEARPPRARTHPTSPAAPVRTTTAPPPTPVRSRTPSATPSSVPPQQKKPTRPSAPHPSTPAPSISAPPTPPVSPSGPPTVIDPRPSGTVGLGAPVVTPMADLDPGWVRVDLPVTAPVVGSVLTIDADRAPMAGIPDTAGTGWSCTMPSWPDGFPGPTRTACTYDGGDSGAVLRFVYWVLPQATLTATLTPPSGYVDTSSDDNVVSVVLRS